MRPEERLEVMKNEETNIEPVPMLDVSPEMQGVDIHLERARETLDDKFGENGIRRVLFVVPPDADEASFNFNTGKRGRYWNYPPYGLGLMASHVRADGIEVEIINLNNAILEACRLSKTEDAFDYQEILESGLRKAIETFKPDLLGVTCMFSQTHPSTVDVCQRLERLAPCTPQALGGVHISNAFMGGATRAGLVAAFPMVDFLFTFEAEIAFRDFVQIVNGRKKTRKLSQVAFFLDGEGLYFTHQRKPAGKDLDVMPDYGIMDVGKLNDNGKIGGFFSLVDAGRKFATVLSNRGCRAQCTFCSVRNFNGVGVRGRSVQSVIDELLYLRTEHDIRHVMWLDDDLLYNSSRAINLFNEMVRQDVDMTWDCTNGVIASSCTEEMMQAAADSGCIGLNIGMETGNPEILRRIKKPGSVKNFMKAAEALRRVEQINARVFIMIGFPGETYGMIQDTIDVVREMDLDWCNVFILQPLPNTPIFDQMMSDGLIGNVDFGEIRFTTGAYGTLRKKADKVRDMLSIDFKDAFSSRRMDEMPTAGDLDDVWAYMNFHLNFARLFRENREAKLLQQSKWLRNITTLIAPDNAFAQYFQGYLSHKLDGHIDQVLIDGLEEKVSRMPYWQDRLNEFNLSPNDLRTQTFPVAVG